MACKNKRLTALILAAVTAFAAIPTSFLLASSTDTAADASADTGEESTVEEHEEIVNDDGTVEQEGALGKVALEDQITIDDYEVVAESDDYNMYFYEPRLSVILENKETGKLMYSTLMDAEDDGTSNSLWNAYMKSGIVCTALQGVKTGQQLDLINTQPKITSKQITNGIEAKVEYTNYGLGLTLQITLDGDKVNYMIPDDSITENAEETGYYFESIIPCPFMGYTYMDDQDGYMLLPDGNGALIRLTNKEGRYLSGFSGVVYGAGFSIGKNLIRLFRGTIRSGVAVSDFIRDVILAFIGGYFAGWIPEPLSMRSRTVLRSTTTAVTQSSQCEEITRSR